MGVWAICTLTLLLGYLCRAQQPTLGPCGAATCRCSEQIIDCQDESLTDIPTFTNDAFNYEVQLDRNLIDEVYADAFRNLHAIRKVFLENNNISSVHNDSFRGLEKTLLRLDISHNALTTLPTAIGALTNIDWIDVQDNPITADQFDEHTLYQIGNTLTRFEFGSSSLASWPTTIRHLQALELLNVTGGSFYTLPPDAFHGFEGTLKTLSIRNTKLIALPLAVSRLRFLDELYFDHNHDIGDSGVLIPSFGDSELLNNLRKISLIDDNLTIFPSILKFLRSVEILILDSNRLAFVSDTSVQDVAGTAIKSLSLRNCSLSRVPGALSKLNHLESLDLADNQIRSFENSDFEGMQHLIVLKINRNPLEFIANESFHDLLCLETLNIMDSNIKTMPEAIRFLGSLKTLQLPTDKIECTCNIVWLKQFIDHCNGNLTIAGSCETINSNVAGYLTTHVPNCPNYQNQSACYSQKCPNTHN